MSVRSTQELNKIAKHLGTLETRQKSVKGCTRYRPEGALRRAALSCLHAQPTCHLFCSEVESLKEGLVAQRQQLDNLQADETQVCARRQERKRPFTLWR